MVNQTWLDDEPGLGAALRQGAELLAAGLRRGWLMLLCAVLLALVIAAALVYVKHDYAPRFVFRVVEADRDPRSMPRMKSQRGPSEPGANSRGATGVRQQPRARSVALLSSTLRLDKTRP